MPQDSVYAVHDSGDSSALPDTVRAASNELPDSLKAVLFAPPNAMNQSGSIIMKAWVLR